ncbi:MAG: hypothetical protein CMI53_04555 [Parcubacteria group bacterium]|nr:hypothetical protein [Parcubacteria group bacterium]
MNYKIAVSGAAAGECVKGSKEKAEEVGRSVAEHGFVLTTGATSGVPYYAAKGAKKAGGTVIGFSPAVSKIAHLKTYKLPLDYHDLIVYTGFDYAGRNLILTRSADAVIVVCGRIGTLNEFTVAFEDNRVIGILEGSGGIADHVRSILDIAKRGEGRIVFDKDPRKLVDKVASELKKEDAKIKKS